MPQNPFIFSPTQFIRIFVIVNVTTYVVAKTYLNSYPPARPPQPHLSDTRTSPNTRVATGTNSQGDDPDMAPKGGKGENTKKVAGNARKAEAAAQKAAAADKASQQREAEKWEQGAKDSSKKAAAAQKAADQAAKKAERDALLAAEEKDQPSKPKGAGKKTAEKKNVGRPLDLSQLDGPGTDSGKMKTLNASGIDNALDALTLTSSSANDMKLDRHPERRYAAAYKAYEERRLPEIKTEHPGLRRNQQIELIKKEFDRSEENPFNQQGNVRYDASKEELADAKRQHLERIEKRLGEK
jgi:hypothetical protein